jgi:hypothetical protein
MTRRPQKLKGEPRRGYPGAARGSGSDRWMTDKARDRHVPNRQNALRISALICTAKQRFAIE